MKRRWLFLAIGLVLIGGAGAAGLAAVAGFFGQLGPPSAPPTIPFKLDAAGLARSAQIKKELEITDEQADKLAAKPEEIAKILSEKQLLRLHQIELQRRGLPALTDKDVGAALKLTEKQEESIKKILDDFKKDVRGAFPPGTKSSLGERMAKVDEMKKVAIDKTRAVLTDDQKKMWAALNGETFHLQLPFAGGMPKKKE